MQLDSENTTHTKENICGVVVADVIILLLYIGWISQCFIFLKEGIHTVFLREKISDACYDQTLEDDLK